jgi:hypothetical protein
MLGHQSVRNSSLGLGEGGELKMGIGSLIISVNPFVGGSSGGVVLVERFDWWEDLEVWRPRKSAIKKGV